MQNSDLSTLTFYEPKYYGLLSPTFHKWARLTAADVHALEEWPDRCPAQDTYFHLNHPINLIRLVGVIVDFEAYDKRFIMVLDDSSGANIEITCPRLPSGPKDTTAKDEAQPGEVDKSARKDHRLIGQTKRGYTVDLTGVDVGSVVKAKGGIGTFRGEKQMTLERLAFVTTNEEAEAWTQNAAYRRDILSKPWVISDDDFNKFERFERRERRRQEEIERERQRRLEGGRKRRTERHERRARHEGIERKMVRSDQCREEHKDRSEGDARHRSRKAAKLDLSAGKKNK